MFRLRKRAVNPPLAHVSFLYLTVINLFLTKKYGHSHTSECVEFAGGNVAILVNIRFLISKSLFQVQNSISKYLIRHLIS